MHYDTVLLQGAECQPFGCDIYYQPEAEPRPAIIICHGFKGFRRWGFFPYAAQKLAEAGFTVLNMDFSHNGTAPDTPLDFTRLDLFEANTISRELADLAAALDFASSHPAVDAGKIGVVGHSRGGATMLVAGFSLAEPRISALTTWNSVSNPNLFPESSWELWREKRYLPLWNARTGQEMRVGVGFLEDCLARREEYDLRQRLSKRPLPTLFLHGTADESVPVRASQDLLGWAGSHARLALVEGANHTFGAVHPFAGPTTWLDEAVAVTSVFFREHLGG